MQNLPRCRGLLQRLLNVLSHDDELSQDCLSHQQLVRGLPTHTYNAGAAQQQAIEVRRVGLVLVGTILQESL